MFLSHVNATRTRNKGNFSPSLLTSDKSKKKIRTNFNWWELIARNHDIHQIKYKS